jgi:DNA-binding transcriptional LysR family regulator
MPLNWDDLRVFQAIAETGSLSAAGRRLGLSQPTTGRRLQALEQAFGTKLFDRHPDGYLLNQKSVALLPRVEEMMRAGEAIERSRLQLEESTSGPVRLSTNHWNCRFISRRLGELQADLPGVELELVTSYSFANLSRREADIAIRNQRPTEGRLAARSLADVSYAIFGSRRYVERHPEALSDARYETCRWIGYDDSLDHLSTARWLMAKIGRPPHQRYNSAAHFMDALLGDAGLAVIPSYFGGEEADLVQVTPVIRELRQQSQWMVVHQDMRDAPRVRFVTDRIAKLYRRYLDVLQPAA